MYLYIIIITAKLFNHLKTKIMKIIFIDQHSNKFMKVLDLKGFIMPRIGEDIIWNRNFMTVQSITHNYDEKEIEIEVEIK